MEGYGAGSGSYLDRLQEKGDAASTRAPGGMAPPPPRAQPPVVPSGPSDYTRVIRGAGPQPLGRPGGDALSAYGSPPPAAAPPPPKPAPAASKTPIIIGLVVTVAVLVALVLFFALRG